MKEKAEIHRIRRTRSIAFRISLLVTLAILIFGALAIYIVTERQSRLYRNEKLKQWETLVDSLTPNLMNLLASSEVEGIHQSLNKVASDNADVQYIHLANENGAILYSTTLEKEGKKFTKPELDALKKDVRQDKESGGETCQFHKEIRSGKTLLGYLYISFRFLPALEKERMTSILTLETAIQGAVRTYLTEMDYYQVDFVTKEMVKNVKDARYYAVISGDGTVVSSSKAGDMLKAVADKYDKGLLKKMNVRHPIWTRKLQTGGKTILEVSLGTFDGETCVGIIKVGYDMTSLNAAIQRGRVILAIITFSCVLLAVAIAIFIATRIARPAVHLVNISKEVGKGNLDVEAKVASGGDEMRMLGSAFNLMIKGLKERNMIKDTFSRYVSKQVAEEILKNPEMISLGGESKEVTILFSDIRGFTTMSERLEAAQVVAVLNEYFNEMVDAVFEYEGTLDKYIGDAIMAVFGSPTTHPDDPLRAVKTAIKMRSKLEELNKKWQLADGGEPLCIGIGLNTGKVIAGNIGHMQRMEYTVIGDNVNLASRIEGLTKNYGCQIIISESTYEKVADFVDVRLLESVKVKGKEQAVQVYELIGMKTNAANPA